MEVVKDREIYKGMYVDVYKNLNKKGLFSIRRRKSGLVVAYAKSVTLQGCKFVVSEKSRLRCLERNVRSVHSVVRGYFFAADEVKNLNEYKVGYYNPFVTPTFINEVQNTPVYEADEVYCCGSRAYYKEEKTEKEQLSIF